MKKLLLILLIIPTLCFARSIDEIKSMVIKEFNIYAERDGDDVEAFKMKLAYSKATTSYKGILYVRDTYDNEKVSPIAIDVWDGTDLVWRLKGSILNAK